MRGEVEIWRGDDLLMKEDNMLVDGAGVLLADIMCANPALAEFPEPTASILDASNYTVQAISFGTSEEAFQNDGHATDEYKDTFFGVMANAVDVGNFSVGAVSHNGEYDGSSLRPVVGLPQAPSPSMERFESATNISAQVGGIDVSSVFPGNGQLVNFTPSAVLTATMEGTPFAENFTSAVAAASLMGGFPESSELPFGSEAVRYHYEDEQIYFNVPADHGNFNDASSMDLSGFVNMVMTQVPDDTYQMSSTLSGLCVSAAPTFATDGVLEYSISLAPQDLGYANVYGGIFHLGLWTIDMDESLANGNTPPFAFSQLNNPRKYRMFARKGLSKNLCHIEDDGIEAGERNRTPLTIKWKIYFL